MGEKQHEDKSESEWVADGGARDVRPSGDMDVVVEMAPREDERGAEEVKCLIRLLLKMLRERGMGY